MISATALSLLLVAGLSQPPRGTHDVERADAMGNLAMAVHANGKMDLRMPDAVGNLFRSNDRRDRKYGPAGQLLESLTKAGITRYAYDPEGNLALKVLPDGSQWKYEWNAAGMLAKVVRPDGKTVEFGYDALGRRVWKKYQGKTTRWVWDGNVPVHEWVEVEGEVAEPAPEKLAESEDAGLRQRAVDLAKRAAQGPPLAITEHGSTDNPITWVFEPESFAPAARLTGGEQHAIIADHLGTPTAMLDGAGRTVWSADIGIYGELRHVVGDKQACPFRWPGQYEDAETGLYYNRFRYYDPDSGEYVSQDPIGLAGGLSLYSYVSDVARAHDALGLTDKVFWSGGKAAKEAAEAFAKATGAEILEMTPTGQALDAFTKSPMDWETEAKPLWNRTSQAFAGSAPSTQKKAIAFIDYRFYRGAASVWEQFERPILEKKGIFTEMRDISKCH